MNVAQGHQRDAAPRLTNTINIILLPILVRFRCCSILFLFFFDFFFFLRIRLEQRPSAVTERAVPLTEFYIQKEQCLHSCVKCVYPYMPWIRIVARNDQTMNSFLFAFLVVFVWLFFVLFFVLLFGVSNSHNSTRNISHFSRSVHTQVNFNVKLEFCVFFFLRIIHCDA